MRSKGEWVEKNAVQAAQFNLGIMCYIGEGVQQNSHEAARWLRMAADQGHVGAHFHLGHLNEQQGEYQAAIVHYRAGQAAVVPEEARYHIRRCVEAIVRAKQEEHQEEQKQEAPQ
jgi:TPR repeat protein